MAAAASALAALDQPTLPLPTIPAAAPVISQHVFNGHKTVAQPAVQQQPKRRFGLWGGQGITWLDDLRRKYPMFDITYADSTKYIERLKNCEKVILMTNLVPAPARQQAKKYLPGKMVYINGTRAEVYALMDAYLSEPVKKN